MVGVQEGSVASSRIHKSCQRDRFVDIGRTRVGYLFPCYVLKQAACRRLSLPLTAFLLTSLS